VASPDSPPDDPLSEVREAALALLSRREHSRRELARKLRRKGHSRDHIEVVLTRLEEVGLVSDERYARLFVTDKLAVRPLGRRRIVQGLRLKGIAAEAAGRALEDVYRDREVDDRSLAESLAKKRAARLSGVEPPAVRRRLAGFLARRGFDAGVVADTVRRVLGEGPGDPAETGSAYGVPRFAREAGGDDFPSGAEGSDPRD
jgi:regulatory protein